ncbi:hypothetical protein BGZ49_004318, partial [Haplosporangium sp. Z 27]
MGPNLKRNPTQQRTQGQQQLQRQKQQQQPQKKDEEKAVIKDEDEKAEMENNDGLQESIQRKQQHVQSHQRQQQNQRPLLLQQREQEQKFLEEQRRLEEELEEKERQQLLERQQREEEDNQRLKKLKLELEQQLEMERQAELEMQQELERQRELELQKSLERKKELERQRELEKQLELERKLELDRQRDLERQRETERQKKEYELQKEIIQKELEVQREIERQIDLEMQLELQQEQQSHPKNHIESLTSNQSHISNSDDAIRGHDKKVLSPLRKDSQLRGSPQTPSNTLRQSFHEQRQNRVQAPQQLSSTSASFSTTQVEPSEIISEIIQDYEPSLNYPHSTLNRYATSSSSAASAKGHVPQVFGSENSCAYSVTGASSIAGGSCVTGGSSVTGATVPESTLVGSRRGSSTTGSVYKYKHHVRKSSFVSGWDSDDDEEMDQAAARAAEMAIVNEKSPWLDRENRKRKKVRTCIWLGVILCFLVCGGVLALVYKEQIFSTIKGRPKDHDHNGTTDNNDGASTDKVQSIEAKFHVNTTITPIPGLSKIFYGIDYTPPGSQEPFCNVNLGTVIEDIKVLSQLTNRIRIYGMACQQAEVVLKAIEYLELPDMQLIMTLWVDSNSTSWDNQQRILWNLIDNDVKMDTSSISNLPAKNVTSGNNTLTFSKSIARINGISVGNEVLYRNEDNTKMDQHVPVSTLTGYISQVKTGLSTRAKLALASSNTTISTLGKQLKEIPVFSSDLGRNAYQIVDDVDEIMSNIHPFFAQVAAHQAANWTIQNYKTESEETANGKPSGISEVGWPSGPASFKL